MKKVLTISLCLLLCVVSFGQPILNYSNSAPQVNDHYVFVNANYLSAGPGGANLIWDFSTLSSSGTDSVRYISIDSALQGNLFPTANVVDKNPGGEIYLLTAATGIDEIGNASATSLVISYSNPERKMVFPFTYNDHFADTFTAVF